MTLEERCKKLEEKDSYIFPGDITVAVSTALP